MPGIQLCCLIRSQFFFMGLLSRRVTREHRENLAKTAKQFSNKAKDSLRRVRSNAVAQVKKVKEGHSEDTIRLVEKQVQKDEKAGLCHHLAQLLRRNCRVSCRRRFSRWPTASSQTSTNNSQPRPKSCSVEREETHEQLLDSIPRHFVAGMFHTGTQTQWQ